MPEYTRQHDARERSRHAFDQFVETKLPDPLRASISREMSGEEPVDVQPELQGTPLQDVSLPDVVRRQEIDQTVPRSATSGPGSADARPSSRSNPRHRFRLWSGCSARCDIRRLSSRRSPGRRRRTHRCPPSGRRIRHLNHSYRSRRPCREHANPRRLIAPSLSQWRVVRVMIRPRHGRTFRPLRKYPAHGGGPADAAAGSSPGGTSGLTAHAAAPPRGGRRSRPSAGRVAEPFGTGVKPSRVAWRTGGGCWAAAAGAGPATEPPARSALNQRPDASPVAEVTSPSVAAITRESVSDAGMLAVNAPPRAANNPPPSRETTGGEAPIAVPGGEPAPPRDSPAAAAASRWNS